MRHLQVTDRRGGERLDRSTWPRGDVIVADNGYGYRRSVAWTVQQQADVVIRGAAFLLRCNRTSPA